MRISTILVLALLVNVTAIAQDRIDPRHPDARTFPELGRMIGTITRLKAQPGEGEQFGYRICPLGDVNHDGLADWLVGHHRIDTLQGIPLPNGDTLRLIPEEFLLYTGVRGGVPTVESGRRIGPVDIRCQAEFLAVGDFDADNNADIVMALGNYADTSYGNRQERQLVEVVVYWGDHSGTYSNLDTTRLPSSGNMWVDLRYGSGRAGDLTGDQVDDLALYFQTGNAYGWGDIVTAPRLHVFHGGRGNRWGRNGVSPSPALRWWSTQYDFTNPRLEIVDQDQDGANDLLVYDFLWNSDQGRSTRISALYGAAGRQGLDTTDMQQVVLTTAEGRNVEMMDVTGDGIPELTMSSGISNNSFRIFAGRKGQRINTQYGSGDDGPTVGNGWWSRPWLEVKQPHALHDGWSPAYRYGVADLGDGNLDGVRDIWTYSEPFLVCYTTGPFLDQWVDGYFRLSKIYEMVNVGDIDGSGEETIALYYDHTPRDPISPFPGGIVYIKPNRQLPTGTGGPPIALPHESVRVDAISEVNEELEITTSRESGTGRVTILLSGAMANNEYSIEVVDLIGQRVATAELSRYRQSVVIDLERGVYFIRMIEPKSKSRSLIVD